MPVQVPFDAIAVGVQSELARHRFDQRQQTLQRPHVLNHQHHREIPAEPRHRRLAEIAAALEQRRRQPGDDPGPVFPDQRQHEPVHKMLRTSCVHTL